MRNAHINCTVCVFQSAWPRLQYGDASSSRSREEGRGCAPSSQLRAPTPSLLKTGCWVSSPPPSPPPPLRRHRRCGHHSADSQGSPAGRCGCWWSSGHSSPALVKVGPRRTSGGRDSNFLCNPCCLVSRRQHHPATPGGCQ